MNAETQKLRIMMNEELGTMNGGTCRPFLKRGYTSIIRHSSFVIRHSSRRAFTLIELLVVVAMIALITGAVSTSLSSAMQRSRIQKATSEVKIISQAILSYENYAGDLDKYVCEDKEIDKSGFPFLLVSNSGQSKQGTKLPALLQASLSAGGVMRDPWGKPYRVTIRKGSITPESLTPTAVQTGYRLQNFYRLTEKERK